VWLEFDLPEGAKGAAIPTPSLCVQWRHAPEPASVTDEVLPQMHGRDLTPFQRQRIRAILAAVPPPGRLLYTFSLRPRGEGAVRLEFFGVPGAATAAFLERAGVPETTPRVLEAAALLGEVDRPHLSIDLLPESVSPRVGLEGSFRRLPHREPRWATLFDRLEGAGLCCPEKRRAVFAWPGYCTPRSAHWPITAGHPLPGFHIRSLSHVKLVCHPERPLETKVYLLAEYWPERPSR
jgi:hypothetical protein